MACETDFRNWEPEYFYYPGEATDAPDRPEQNGAAILSDTRAVLFGNSQEGGVNNTPPSIRVLDISGTTHTQLSIDEAPQDADLFQYHRYRAATRINNTRFAIFYERYDNVVAGDPVTFDNYLVAVLCDLGVGGVGVTFHDYAVVKDLSGQTAYRDLTITAIDSDKLLATAIFDGVVYGYIGTIVGNTITFGAEFQILDNVQSVSFADRTYTTFISLDGGRWAGLVYAGPPHLADIGDPDEKRYGMYLVVGNTASNTTFQYLGPAGSYTETTWVQSTINAHICKLDTAKALIGYEYRNFDDHENPQFPGDAAWQQVNYIMRTVYVGAAGTLDALGTEEILMQSTIDFNWSTGTVPYGGFFDFYADNSVLMSATIEIYDSGSRTYHRERFTFLNIDVDDITITDTCDVPYFDAPVTFIPSRALLHIDGNKFFQLFSEGNDYWRYISLTTIDDILACCAVPELLLLGLSTVGSTAYVTAWADDNLVLNIVDLGLGQQVDSIALGTATLAQVTAKTYIAYPCAISNSQVYIFGRINTGSQIAHIMYSEDTGSNFEIIEGDWGLDYAGAMICRSSDNFYVARCNSFSSKLYEYNNGELVVRSTLPFNGPVMPHGLRFSNWDESILAAVDSAGEAQTVVYAIPPHYLSWNDVTFNHPQTAVNAIVPL